MGTDIIFMPENAAPLHSSFPAKINAACYWTSPLNGRVWRKPVPVALQKINHRQRAGCIQPFICFGDRRSSCSVYHPSSSSLPQNLDSTDRTTQLRMLAQARRFT